MVTYTVEVVIGMHKGLSQTDLIYITLVGALGESPRQNLGDYFPAGSVEDYEIECDEDLGELLLIRLHKERSRLIEAPWFCQHVTVTDPSGKKSRFPCYLWFYGYPSIDIPEGKGAILTGELNPLFVEQRSLELKRKRETYRWKSFAQGVPRCIDAPCLEGLPWNERFSHQYGDAFEYSVASTKIELQLKEYTKCKDPWADLDINICFEKTHNSELVSKMWNEDTFFGYQYLNGPNPFAIRKCTDIPKNFPVDQEMVAEPMGPGTNLQTELKEGNVFLVDYKMLEGITPNVINGKEQYLAAPLCLLWKNPHNDLIPIAIQLGQTPGPENPIFLPSDEKWDWTLAKIWVRNAEFQMLQVGLHLLRTHLLAEVFSIATTRQLPMHHPVYKLVVPHFQNILRMNIMARNRLLASGGLFEQTMAIGSKGAYILLKRAMEEVTYQSLFLLEDIHARGMDSIPNYYYRDDGLKIWSALRGFLVSIVNCYYTNDDMVANDAELQAWVSDIYKEGFLGLASTGMPSSLKTQSELINLLTMVIFTCSVQHTAFNSSQFDFCSWMPNAPSSMRQPPPKEKGSTTLQTILEALPEVNTTATAMAMVWIFYNEPDAKKSLENFPVELFTVEVTQEHIKDLQERLDDISKEIRERETNRNLTYHYLDPKQVKETKAPEPPQSRSQKLICDLPEQTEAKRLLILMAFHEDDGHIHMRLDHLHEFNPCW